MRSVARNAITAAALAFTTIAWSGCDAKKQTEYVAGFSTQMTVPRDIASVVVIVSVGGVNVFCQPYQVYNQRVLLPKSLGEFPASGTVNGNPLTVSVIGLTDVTTDQSGNPFVSDCSFTAQTVGDPTTTARILRRSRQPYIQDQVLFLPMPLRYSCMDVECSNQDTTCKAGRCAPVDTDPATLPLYRDDLLDGTGGACFSSSLCFAAAVPAVTVDQDSCTYAIPNTPSAPAPLAGAPPNPIVSSGSGINVEITYDGGLTTEVLDLDPDEGFTIPDATKPQRFTLVPGLCDLVKGVDPSGNPTAHRITEVRATGLCQAKNKFQPLCADDMNNAMGTPGGVSPHPDLTACAPTTLTPSKSVLMILADNTLNNKIFYDGSEAGAGEIVEGTFVGEALADPTLKNAFLGLTFFPTDAANIGLCTPHTPVVQPVIAKNARQPIAAQFAARQTDAMLLPLATDLRMTGALNDAYDRLRQPDVSDANRRAVFVISNRDFDQNTCNAETPAQAAAAAFGTDKINTYVGVLARDFAVPKTVPPALPPTLVGEDDLAKAGAAPSTSPAAYDIRTDPNNALQSALRKVVNEVGTCAYDITTSPTVKAPDPTAVLEYTDPLGVGDGAKPKKITFDAACTSNDADAANMVGGWGSVTLSPTKTRIFICGGACTAYQGTLSNAATYTVLYSPTLPPPEIPIFAYNRAVRAVTLRGRTSSR